MFVCHQCFMDDATKMIVLSDGRILTVCDQCVVEAIEDYAGTENPVYELSEIGDDPERSL